LVPDGFPDGSRGLLDRDVTLRASLPGRSRVLRNQDLRGGERFLLVNGSPGTVPPGSSHQRLSAPGPVRPGVTGTRKAERPRRERFRESAAAAAA